MEDYRRILQGSHMRYCVYCEVVLQQQLSLDGREPGSFLQPLFPLLAAAGIQPAPVIGTRRIDQNLQRSEETQKCE